MSSSFSAQHPPVTSSPVVPKSHRRSVFTTIHVLAHPGIRVSQQLISSLWLWKGMSSDIVAWCRDCQHCQRGKVTLQYTAPLHPIIPSRHFSHIHFNLVGPLPSCDGANKLLTIIDRSTHWLEAIPHRSTTAIADTLLDSSFLSPCRADIRPRCTVLL